VTIVVPFPPGGGADATARVIGQRLSEGLKVPVVVRNSPGGSTQIATNQVVRATPDGYTLLLAANSLVNNVHLFPKLPYDASRDLRPVISLVDVPIFLAVGPKVTATTTRDFIAMAKKKSGELNFGSAGIGSAPHLVSEWFKSNAGFEATHIPFQGSGPQIVALASGQVDFSFENLAGLLPQLRANRVRLLAVASSKRFPGLPNVPTVKESGLPDQDLSSWFLLMAPAATPDHIVKVLNEQINLVLQQPELRRRLISQGMVPVGGTPQAVVDRLPQESGKWGQIINAAKVKAE
jgi:tripartite-type tricarboxylate transporter receptor subunit TctC